MGTRTSDAGDGPLSHGPRYVRGLPCLAMDGVASGRTATLWLQERAESMQDAILPQSYSDSLSCLPGQAATQQPTLKVVAHITVCNSS